MEKPVHLVTVTPLNDVIFEVLEDLQKKTMTYICKKAASPWNQDSVPEPRPGRDDVTGRPETKGL